MRVVRAAHQYVPQTFQCVGDKQQVTLVESFYLLPILLQMVE